MINSLSVLRILLFGAFVFFCRPVQAQMAPAIGSVADRDARSKQLLGEIDSSVSFTVRPISVESKKQVLNEFSVNDSDRKLGKPVHFAKGKGVLYFLPLTITQQFNSHHPYGWNDGAMIAAKGYQALVSTGIHTSIGPLDIQLQPEFIYAANSSFEHSADYGSDTKAYTKLFPGQSTISLSSGKLSIGISSASMWWGPGIRSSLLMSNNAPGFGHFFFKTKKPVRTGIGNFEWQLIGGWLTSNDSLSYENLHLLRHAANRISATRYLSGLVLSYQPKWVPGLFLGFTRSVQTYAKDNLLPDINFFERYFPVIALAVQKRDVGNEDSLKRDQLASFFLRWMFPKTNLEFYFEYGFNDYGVNFRDYLMSPSHSAAHIVGIRKIIPRTLTRRIEVGIEITQMSQSPDMLVRNSGNWYTHGQIFEGYTNQNQILGAGAGFGANLLSLDIAWINGLKRLGFLLERVERDPQSQPVKWIDFGVGILPEWKYRQMLFAGKFELVDSKRYMWQEGVNRLNFHSRLSISYLF